MHVLGRGDVVRRVCSASSSLALPHPSCGRAASFSRIASACADGRRLVQPAAGCVRHGGAPPYCLAPCGVGARGAAVWSSPPSWSSPPLLTCPSHRSRHQPSTASSEGGPRAHERTRPGKAISSRAESRGTGAGGCCSCRRASADIAPPADAHSLTSCATRIRKEGRVRRLPCTRISVFAHVHIYIIYIIFAAPLGFYEAVLLPPRQRGAHSKNHTTDKRNGGIISRS